MLLSEGCLLCVVGGSRRSVGVPGSFYTLTGGESDGDDDEALCAAVVLSANGMA